MSYSLEKFSTILSFSSLFNEKRLFRSFEILYLVDFLSLIIWLFANGSNKFLEKYNWNITQESEVDFYHKCLGLILAVDYQLNKKTIFFLYYVAFQNS